MIGDGIQKWTDNSKKKPCHILIVTNSEIITNLKTLHKEECNEWKDEPPEEVFGN